MGNSSSTDGPQLGSSTTTEQACLGRDLSGKLAIVTGCSAGIGVATVTQLVKQGCTVVMANRNAEKSANARDTVLANLGDKEKYGSKLILLTLDLSSLESIRAFVTSFLELKLPQTLSIICNNAGIMALDAWTPSKDGYELQFATNFLGHFYLTTLLIQATEAALAASAASSGAAAASGGDEEKSEPAPEKKIENLHELRVVNVSSTAHGMTPDLNAFAASALERKDGPDKESYGAWSNYGLSKALNIIFAREAVPRFAGLKHLKLVSVSLHPGVIQTELQRHMPSYQQTGMKLFGAVMKSVSQGAATSVYLCCEETEKIDNGGYYSDCKATKVNSKVDASKTAQAQKQIWELAELLITQKGFSLTI